MSTTEAHKFTKRSLGGYNVIAADGRNLGWTVKRDGLWTIYFRTRSGDVITLASEYSRSEAASMMVVRASWG